MHVPPLSHMARRACLKNIRQITDVGDAPYDVVRPVLIRLENPEHLRQIEEKSPQICGADAEIWRDFIKRDIPNWEKKPHEPMNPTSWYKVYRKLLKESKKEVDQDAQLLKATLDGIKSKQAQNTAKKVELSVVKLANGMKPSGDVIKLPRNSTFFAKEQNTKDLKPEFVQWERKHGRIGGEFLHPKLKAADLAKVAPKSKISKFKKQAMAMSRFPKKEQPGVQEMKTKPPIAKVTAPPSLLREYQIPASLKPIDPTIPSPKVFNPRKRRIEHVTAPEAVDRLEQREERLKALTKPSSVSRASPGPTYIRAPRIHRQPSDPSTFDRSGSEKGTSPPIPDPHPSVNLYSPLQSSTSSVLATNNPIPRAKTTSPTGSVFRPTARLKAKAPVNPFMPVKRQRVF